MKERFMRFMAGRYGFDQLSRLSSTCALVCLIISMFVFKRFFYFAGLVLLIVTYFRVFSRKHYKRAYENTQYLKMTSGIRNRMGAFRSEMQQRKIYHIYRCPSCRQKIRVPKGKGRIEVRCPKSSTTFIKNS